MSDNELVGDEPIDEAEEKPALLEAIPWQPRLEGQLMYVWERVYTYQGYDGSNYFSYPSGSNLYCLTEEEAIQLSNGEKPVRHKAVVINGQYFLINTPIFPRGAK